MGYIDLKKLTIDELVGVVNLYPWFGGARVELCERMSRLGGDAWGEAQFADAAMYVSARGKLSDMMRSSRKNDWTDADIGNLLKSYIVESEPEEEVEVKAKPRPSKEKRKVYAGAGDYFTQDDYDQVRSADDNVFSRYAAKAREDRQVSAGTDPIEFDLYTETLAQIYADQGYYEHAKAIYSKLILAYPEKSAYFASLIERINGLTSI